MKLFCLKVKSKSDPWISLLVLNVFLLSLQNDLKRKTVIQHFWQHILVTEHGVTPQGYNTKYGKQRQVLLILKCCNGAHSRQPADITSQVSLSPWDSIFIFLWELTLSKALAQDFRSSCDQGSVFFFLASSKFMAFFRMTYWDDDWWSVTFVMETGSPVHQVTTINISQPSVG